MTSKAKHGSKRGEKRWKGFTRAIIVTDRRGSLVDQVGVSAAECDTEAEFYQTVAKELRRLSSKYPAGKYDLQYGTGTVQSFLSAYPDLLQQ